MEGPNIHENSIEPQDFEAELDLDGKTLEELQEMKNKIGEMFLPNISEERAQELEDAIEEIEARERDMRAAVQEKPSEIPDEFITMDIRGKSLPELKTIYDQAMTYLEHDPNPADRADLNDLLDELDSEISKQEATEQVNEEASLAPHFPSQEWTGKGRENLAWPNEQFGGSWSERASAPARALGSDIEEDEPLSRFVPQEISEDDARFAPPGSIIATKLGETSSETKEGSESSEEMEKAKETLKEELTKDETSERAEAIKEAIDTNWLRIIRGKIFGDMTGKEIISTMATSAAISAGIKTTFRATLGLGGGIGAGALVGAATGVAKTVGMAEWKDMKYERTQKMFDKGRAGEVYERMKNGKIKKADAVQLLAEEKERLIKEEDAEEFYKLLEVESTLIKNEGELSSLKGGERLKRYMELTSSSAYAPSAKERAVLQEEREKEIEQLFKELAITNGRGYDAKLVTRAALIGAVGGALGATVAHAVGGILDGHFGHHIPAPAHVQPDTMTHLDTAIRSDSIPHAAVPRVEPSVRLEPSHTGVPHAQEATPQSSQDLKVRGSVWNTVKQYFKSKGYAPTNDELNEATRYIAQENHIGIAADHPGAGTYDVLDTKVHDGMMLHGVDKLTDIHHIPHVSSEVHMPDAPHIEISHIYTPDELSEGLGISPDDFSAVDPTHTTVVDVYGWIANADITGAKIHAALAIDGLKPSANDMHMTISDFIKQRLVEAHAERTVAHSVSETASQATHAVHASVSHSAHHTIASAKIVQNNTSSMNVVPDTVAAVSEGSNSLMCWILGGGAVAAATGVALYKVRKSRKIKTEANNAAESEEEIVTKTEAKEEKEVEAPKKENTKQKLENAKTPEQAQKLSPKLRIEKVMSMLNPRNDSEIGLTPMQREERLTKPEAKKIKELLVEKKYYSVGTELWDIWKAAGKAKRVQIEKSVEFLKAFDTSEARSTVEIFKTNIKSFKDQEKIANPTS